jgi:DNA polymerase (family 10)
MLDTGKMKTLNDYLEKTPVGIIEMLNVKGIGPKKINTIWKELEVESIGELLYACNENRLLLYKVSGKKHRIISGSPSNSICKTREPICMRR